MGAHSRDAGEFKGDLDVSEPCSEDECVTGSRGKRREGAGD